MLPTDLPLLRTPGAPALSPDGTTVVVPVLAPDLEADEPTGALWTVPADGAAPPRRLTRGHRDTAPEWSPDGTRLAFLRAERGGKPQVHVVEASGGEPVRLTDAPLGAADPQWSPDGSRIAFVARVPEDGRYVAGGNAGAEAPRLVTSFQYRSDDVGFVRDRRQHVWVVDVPDLAAGVGAPLPGTTRLTGGDTDVTRPRWLDDAHLVALAAVHEGRESDLRRTVVLVDARAAETPDSLPTALVDVERVSLTVDAAEPAADGTSLWLLASELGPSGTDFIASLTGLWRLPLGRGAGGDGAGGDGAPAAAADPVRLTDAQTVDLSPATLAPAAAAVLVAELRRGAVVLVAVDAAGVSRDVVGAPAVVQAAAVAGDLAVVSAARPDSAGDLLAVHLTTGAVTALTDLSGPLRATGRTRLPRELAATAPDGYPVHGWVALPDPARFGAGPHPTILMIHGGPFAQYTHGLFDEVQVLAEAGYAVVYGNPRGSAGYGAAHGRSIVGGFGTVDADDVLALLDAALADPELGLDAARVGVMGGSYGGYMTAWLTTRTQRFTAAVVERGFLDPVSFVGSSDIGWFFGLAYLGDAADEAGAAAVASQSPMAHVGSVRTPTLVIHSENDWRCPVEQGQRWFVELKRRGVPTELLLFPGEGHELTRSGRPTHRAVRFEHVLRWWETHLPV